MTAADVVRLSNALSREDPLPEYSQGYYNAILVGQNRVLDDGDLGALVDLILDK